MADQTFYVKIRGRVLGPFPPRRLAQMAKQGQLSRVHQLSADGSTWNRADNYPEFFDSDGSQGAQTQQANQQSQEASPGGSAANPPQAAAVDWHYGINGNSAGPVPKSKIIEMIQSQSLSAEDLLWNKEMDNWLPVDRLPEFGAYLVKSSGVANEALNVVSQQSAGKVDLTETARLLKSQSPWVMFISILLYVSAACLFLLFLFSLVKGGQERDPQLIGVGIGFLVLLVVFLVAAIFLSRFVSGINRFNNSRQVSDLNQSFSWLYRFWLLISIVLIIWLFLVFVVVIYIFSIGGVFL